MEVGFNEYIRCILHKIHKTIGILKKCQPISLRSVLVTIYKSSGWSGLDYVDVIYDEIFDEWFHKEWVYQRRDVKSSSSEKTLYQELDLEPLSPGNGMGTYTIFLIFKILKYYTKSFQIALKKPKTI